jgi:predicted anti-sigma-YlaC factor YlaD
MNCQQATQLISQAQDGALSVPQKLRLKVHVMLCSGCRNFSLQVPFISQAMKAYTRWDGEPTDTTDTPRKPQP